MVGAPSTFTILLVHTSIPKITTNNPLLYFSQFLSPYFTSLLLHKNIPEILTNILFLYTSTIFCLLIFTYSHSYNSYWKILSPKAWTGITAITITDSLSLRFRKLYITGNNLWWGCFWSEWETMCSTLFLILNLLLFPCLISTITRPHMPLETNCLTDRIFMFYILVYFSYLHPPLCLEILPYCHIFLSHIKPGSQTSFMLDV